MAPCWSPTATTARSIGSAIPSSLARGAALAALLLLAAAAATLAASFEERAAACLACHGQNGQSLIPETPSIGGQPEYLLKTMREYKRGTRIGYGAAMTEELHGLSDDDLQALAHFFAHLPRP
jgi:cytochrome c553